MIGTQTLSVKGESVLPSPKHCGLCYLRQLRRGHAEDRSDIYLTLGNQYRFSLTNVRLDGTWLDSILLKLNQLELRTYG